VDPIANVFAGLQNNRRVCVSKQKVYIFISYISDVNIGLKQVNNIIIFAVCFGIRGTRI